ncbi:MAG: hypothetical protein COB15_01475 [Flavobacteriales bacterium]|nr:MAG: hypothetical protein COB15_01475 [Flavobacteriales bacterium]
MQKNQKIKIALDVLWTYKPMLSTRSVQMLKQYKSNCPVKNGPKGQAFFLFLRICPFTPNAGPHFFRAYAQHHYYVK